MKQQDLRSVWYLRCGNWNGNRTRTLPLARALRSSALDASGRSLGGRRATPRGSTSSLAGRPRARHALRGRRVVLSASPTRRSEDACRGQRRRGPRRACAASATPAAPPASTPLAAASARGLRDLLAPSAADLPRRRRAARRSAVCDRRRPRTSALGFAERLAEFASGWIPSRSPEEARAAYHAAASSPRTSWSRSRSRRPSCSSGPASRTRARAARPARPAHGGQLVRARRARP